MLARFSAWITANAGDIIFTVGLLALVVGAGMAWLPLAPIVFGITVCGVMIWDKAANKPPRQEPPDA